MCDICVCMRVCEYMYTIHTTGLQKNGAEAFSPFKWDSAVPSFVGSCGVYNKACLVV